jgi:hypothetical protein
MKSIDEPDETCNVIFPACPDYQKQKLMDDVKASAVKPKTVNKYEKIKESINAWMKNDIIMKEEEGTIEIHLPFFPIHDHGISIYINEKDDCYEITDNGETGGELFMNGFETTERALKMVENICKYHEVTMIRAKNDVETKSLGEFKVKASSCDIMPKVSRLFCAIIQTYSLYFM